MKLRKLWSISKYVYREVLFKSYIYQQNINVSDPEALKKALRGSSVIFYKTMMGIVAVLYPISTFMLIFIFAGNIELEVAQYFISVILGSMVLMDAFLVILLGLTQSSVIFMPSIYAPLKTLSLSDNEISIIALVTFFRVFDIFIISVTIISSILAQIAFRNALLTFLVFFIQSLVFILAMWFVIPVAVRVSRILMVPVVSKKKVLIRILFYSVYVFVLSMVYVLPSLTMSRISESILAGEISPFVKALATYIPPFCSFYLGFVLVFGTGEIVYPIIGTLFLILLSLFGLRNVTRTFREFKVEIPISTIEERMEIVKEFKLKSKFKALLDKDTKLLIRNANYAPLLFIGPMIFMIYLIMHLFGMFSINFVINFSLYLASLYIFLSPALIQLEGRYLDFIRTLPIDSRDFIKSKALILTISYLAYAIMILAFVLFTGNFSIFAMLSILNVIGVYSGIYVILAKVLNDVITEEKGAYSVINTLGFWAYALLIMLFYYILPYTVLLIASTGGYPEWVGIVSVIILQAIYYVTVKLKKLVKL